MIVPLSAFHPSLSDSRMSKFAAPEALFILMAIVPVSHQCHFQKRTLAAAMDSSTSGKNFCFPPYHARSTFSICVTICNTISFVLPRLNLIFFANFLAKKLRRFLCAAAMGQHTFPDFVPVTVIASLAKVISMWSLHNRPVSEHLCSGNTKLIPLMH